MNLIRGGGSAALNQPDRGKSCLMCVLCGLSLGHRADGSCEKEQGSHEHVWVLETNLPSPSPQPPVPPESPMGLETESDKATSIHAPFKALIQRGLGGGGDFFSKTKQKGVDGFLLWRRLNSP